MTVSQDKLIFIGICLITIAFGIIYKVLKFILIW